MRPARCIIQHEQACKLKQKSLCLGRCRNTSCSVPVLDLGKELVMKAVCILCRHAC